MNSLLRHFSRCLIAGIIAILPIGGMVLSLVWMETTISESWMARQAFYFPGLGLLAAAVVIYLIGLAVSTFLGRWLWNRIDQALKSLPALGRLYETLKQILGYGEGEQAIFREVVMIPSPFGGHELGLVTNRMEDGRALVFVPSSPNPANGRLVVVEQSRARRIDLEVHEALKALVSAGATGVGVRSQDQNRTE